MAWSKEGGLYLGNCLEILPYFPDNSIDLVCSDPPYGKTGAHWDSLIPLGPLWRQLTRILRPAGAVALTAVQPFTSALVTSNPAWFRYCLVWIKDHGVGCQAHGMPIQVHEDVVVFSPGTCGNGGANPMRYFPQGVRPMYKHCRALDGGPGRGLRPGRKAVYREWVQRWTGFPHSVLYFPKDVAASQALHHTQKPEAMLEYLIRTYTQPGDVVLDFCMGSGSTGAACVTTGRIFHGIEKSAEFYSRALGRLAGQPLER